MEGGRQSLARDKRLVRWEQPTGLIHRRVVIEWEYHEDGFPFLFSRCDMNIFDRIQRPTLLLDEQTARANMARMVGKAESQGVRFRPHFKTHQSAEIGKWCREEGVRAITVSSVEMAEYFADSGWDDITVAFPVNWREAEAINELAGRARVSLVVEAGETVLFLERHLRKGVDCWIKIDVGSRRTGMDWRDTETICAVARQVQGSDKLHLRGLLSHAGHTYRAGSPEAVRNAYAESLERLNGLRVALVEAGLEGIEISVGDTPSASLCDDWGRVDEMRCGNFVLYDATQLRIGSCRAEDIAVALTCPVVAKHAERNQVVVHGGAVHLSSEHYVENDHKVFGLVCLPEENGRWGTPLAGASVSSLSQEHGILTLRAEDTARVKIGGLVCILPAHACITVASMRGYMTLEGRTIETLNSSPRAG